MSADYGIPMAGELKVFWNIGVDEEGRVEGFIGTPVDAEKSIGATLEWHENRIERFSDDDMEEAIRLAARYALQEYVLPVLMAPVVAAAIEQRQRAGGYVPVETGVDDVEDRD